MYGLQGQYQQPQPFPAGSQPSGSKGKEPSSEPSTEDPGWKGKEVARDAPAAPDLKPSAGDMWMEGRLSPLGGGRGASYK